MIETKKNFNLDDLIVCKINKKDFDQNILYIVYVSLWSKPKEFDCLKPYTYTLCEVMTGEVVSNIDSKKEIQYINFGTDDISNIRVLKEEIFKEKGTVVKAGQISKIELLKVFAEINKTNNLQ